MPAPDGSSTHSLLPLPLSTSTCNAALGTATCTSLHSTLFAPQRTISQSHSRVVRVACGARSGAEQSKAADSRIRA